jgi:hypothetical protein
MLDRHADGSINFGTRLMIGTGPQDIFRRGELKEAVRELFADDNEVALFYFAGHGYIESTGGHLCAGDYTSGDDGLPLTELMTLANASKAKNKIMMLDSCRGGVWGSRTINTQLSEISEGVAILAASTEDQYFAEENRSGLFTGLLIDALGGATTSLVGDVTLWSIYDHIDQSLGAWDQRPVFKTYIRRYMSLRRVQPTLSLADLQRISELFPSAGFEFPLDPAYEPTDHTADPDKNAVFAILKEYNRVNLVIPVGVPQMWDAAVQSKTVKLTALGEHYRRLSAKGLI